MNTHRPSAGSGAARALSFAWEERRFEPPLDNFRIITWITRGRHRVHLNYYAFRMAGVQHDLALSLAVPEMEVPRGAGSYMRQILDQT